MRELFDLLDLDLAETEWQEHAICASIDPALWHPDKGGSPHQALKFCQECPVRKPCLDFAMEWEAREDVFFAYGIYGGMTANQRLKLRADRNRLAAQERNKDAISEDEGDAA